MGEVTGISWTDSTFNPWVGCSKVSPGCDHCYAETYDKRVGGHVVTRVPRWGAGAPRQHTSRALWRQPEGWNTIAGAISKAAHHRRRVFCASLADVFDIEVPAAWRAELFDLIRRTPRLDWQLLTKRPEYILKAIRAAADWIGFETTPVDPDAVLTLKWLAEWEEGHPPANVWLGTTVEDQERAQARLVRLLDVPAAIRFVSVEPMLGPVDLRPWLCSGGLDWVICGGESGGKARTFEVTWARVLRDHCAAEGVAFFMKQLGADPRGFCANSLISEDEEQQTDETFCDLWEASESPNPCSGKCHFISAGANSKPENWPADLRVQQFPTVRP